MVLVQQVIVIFKICTNLTKLCRFENVSSIWPTEIGRRSSERMLDPHTCRKNNSIHMGFCGQEYIAVNFITSSGYICNCDKIGPLTFVRSWNPRLLIGLGTNS